MRFRHEWKHEINGADLLILRQRLRLIMQRDANAENGSYWIRSLYFDNDRDKVLLEKINGVNHREKFRIRYYNGNVSFCRLEKKSKINGLCQKESCPLTAAQIQQLLGRENNWMTQSEHALCRELAYKIRGQGLHPKTIIDYIREPFVFPVGHVRVTLDHHIRTSGHCAAFLQPDCVTLPVAGNPVILEVKWDEFLPDIIRDAVQLTGRHTSPFSKYAAGRIYG